MTRKTFYAKLKKTVGEFEWKLSREGKIRAKKNGRYYCPVTAVSFVETGKRRRLTKDVDVAGDEIGLDDEVAEVIVLSADNNIHLVDLEDKNLARNIRKAMLTHLNLKERTK